MGGVPVGIIFFFIQIYTVCDKFALPFGSYVPGNIKSRGILAYALLKPGNIICRTEIRIRNFANSFGSSASWTIWAVCICMFSRTRNTLNFPNSMLSRMHCCRTWSLISRGMIGSILRKSPNSRSTLLPNVWRLPITSCRTRSMARASIA